MSTPQQNAQKGRNRLDFLLLCSSMAGSVSLAFAVGLINKYFAHELHKDWYCYIPLLSFAATCCWSIALAAHNYPKSR